MGCSCMFLSHVHIVPICLKQKPHNHQEWTSEIYSELLHSENYCRNPGGYERVPWCFTIDASVRWEKCDIPLCDPNECPFVICKQECRLKKVNGAKCPTCVCKDDCMVGNNRFYQGTTNVTKTGIPCQRWDVQEPHDHQFWNPEMYIELRNSENYCRIPGRNEPAPWCYTMNPTVRWEYCDIQICEDCIRGNGQFYQGTTNVTVTGIPCIRWDIQIPHYKQYWFRTKYPELMKSENYCRNPGGEVSVPWCYIMESSDEWQYCDIPLCEVCTRGNGRSYQGTVDVTSSGIPCQRWDVQEPHYHKYWNQKMYPELLHSENYCRNPGGEVPVPWCFTMDATSRWEYCSIPRCACDCGHSASCEYIDDSKVCSCPNGYQQREDRCEACACGHSASCEYIDELKVCSCPNGYQQREDKCEECICGEGTCSFMNNTKVCNCIAGYFDSNGTCVDCNCGPESYGCIGINNTKLCECERNYEQIDDTCKLPLDPPFIETLSTLGLIIVVSGTVGIIFLCCQFCVPARKR